MGRKVSRRHEQGKSVASQERPEPEIDVIVAAVRYRREEMEAKRRTKKATDAQRRADRQRDIEALYVNYQSLKFGAGAWSDEMLDTLLGKPEINDRGVPRFLRARVEAAQKDPRFAEMLRRAKLIAQTTVRGRGWTQALIERFMPEPDVLAKNPHYKSAAPMKLYRTGRVEDIEATEAFTVFRSRAAVKIEGAKRAAATRKVNLRLKHAVDDVILGLREREHELLVRADGIVRELLAKEQALVGKASKIVRAAKHADRNRLEREIDATIAQLPESARREIYAAVRLPKGTPNRRERERKAFRDEVRSRVLTERDSSMNANAGDQE